MDVHVIERIIAVEGIDAFEAAEQEIISESSIQAAAMVISVVPMLCVYPFLQKYFVKGVMVGAVKG